MANLIVSGNSYKVDSLYQWDINQVLQIHGLSIPDPEIHFVNEAMSCTIPGYPKVDDKGVISVDIPNSLLQKHYSITAYVCGYEGETFKTYCKVRIPVIARSKPGDYTLEVTDEEVYSFNELTRRVVAVENSLVDNVNNIESEINTKVATINATLNNHASNISANKTLANEALSIAKGKNQARVFATTEDMYAWLSDSTNIGGANVGDNLYIVAVEVSDWWISEVLTEPNDEGYYYNIAPLETQKVDLTDIINDIEAINGDIEELTALVNTNTQSLDDHQQRFDTLGEIILVGGEDKDVAPQTGTSATTVVSATLEAGTYVIVSSVNFANNNADLGGWRRIALLQTENNVGTAKGVTSSCGPAVGISTCLQIFSIVKLTSPTTYYLNVQHDADVTLSCNGQIRAMRIA